MRRNEFFAALFIVGCVNGLGAQIIDTTRADGWANAVFSTFGTSAIVWIACYAGIRLILHGESGGLRVRDIVVGSALLIPIALPTGGFSWFAISALSLYVMLLSSPSPEQLRGTIILFAATLPMFWSHLLFRFFGDVILSVDAKLVGLLLGTGSNGNNVPFVDGSGSLIIMPFCSSVSNVLLAFLAWLLVTQWQPRRWSIVDLSYCFVALASVVSVNITRIGLMGLSQQNYRAIHSQWGDMTANLLILGLTLVICLLGVRRETDACLQ